MSAPLGARARRAAEIAKRNLLIAKLAKDGVPAAALAVLTKMTRGQISRILASVATLVDPLAPDPAADASELTPVELRELRREHASDPAALEWLGQMHVDRRHNGKPMVIRDRDDFGTDDDFD